MENLPPIPPSSNEPPKYNFQSRNQQPVIGWEMIEPKQGSSIPCQRSLHAGAIWRDQFLVFGGYDGLHRVNDLHSFHFKTNTWHLLTNENAPAPRDRHVAVVYSNFLYIFGGFDGVSRVNDLHCFDLEKNRWQLVVPTAGTVPTARHSHSAVVFQDSIYIFGGILYFSLVEYRSMFISFVSFVSFLCSRSFSLFIRAASLSRL
jgi:N-acetylneuraminic acid mutarotase